MKILFVFFTATLIAIPAVNAEFRLTWPQFRGPNGSGIADDQKPPVEFGPEKNVKWKVAVPSGLSSPIAVGDLIVITAFENDKLYTIAYKRIDGQEAWRAEAPVRELEAYHKTEGSPAASTPASDGEHIVSYFGSCGLVCYDLSGKELWKHELPPAVIGGGFGSGVSPIIADGTVVLVRDQTNEPKIIAVDLATGDVKWERKRTSTVSYCTPVVWETTAGKQVVAAGHARMIGYDLATGEEKWSTGGIPSGCCASPVTAEGVLYFAGWTPGGEDDPENPFPTFDSLLKDLDKNSDGSLARDEAEKQFQGFFDTQDHNKDDSITRDEWDMIIKFFSEGESSAFALKPGGSGDVSESHKVWKQTKGLPYLPSAILYRGQLVMVKDGGVVTAYDAATGTEIYQRRAAESGTYYASPVAAGGHIYFTSLEGAVTVLEAGADKPVVVAKNPPLEEKTAATPAIADDTLYVRTDKHLYAFANE